MIGPLTIRACKAVDKFIEELGTRIWNDVRGEELNNTEFSMIYNPVLLAAHGVCKDQAVHPRILWRGLWFFYYQAWLWRISRKWREKVIEKWLEMIESKGELEAMLDEPGHMY